MDMISCALLSSYRLSKTELFPPSLKQLKFDRIGSHILLVGYPLSSESCALRTYKRDLMCELAISEKFVRNFCTRLPDDTIIFQKMVVLESLSLFLFCIYFLFHFSCVDYFFFISLPAEFIFEIQEDVLCTFILRPLSSPSIRLPHFLLIP